MIKAAKIATVVVFALAILAPTVLPQKLSMDPADLVAALQQIDAATPKGLPQSPVVPRETTDAQELNLKGRVKSVFEEVTTLSSPFKEPWRAVINYTEFNASQNLIRDASFDWRGGGLHGVTVYGYLKGMRVNLDGPAPTGNRFTTGVWGDPGKIEEKKGIPDLRYTFAFSSKYKDGRLVEKQLFNNDGRKQNRIVYDYKKNEVEYRKYLPSGEFNEHHIYVYDSDGNEIEHRAYHGGAGGVTDRFSTYKTKYERFDAERNWTERSVYAVSVVDEKRTEKLIRREYRRIEYFK